VERLGNALCKRLKQIIKKKEKREKASYVNEYPRVWNEMIEMKKI